MRRTLAALALVLPLALPHSAHAGGLTADQVAAAATTTDPGLASRRADIRAAAAGVDQALAAYLPRTAITASYTRLSSIESPSLGDIVVAPMSPSGAIAPGSTLVNVPLALPQLRDQWSLESRISVPVSDYVLRLSHNLAAARRSAHAAAMLEQADRRSVATGAKLAYYAWARAKLAVAVAADAVHRADVHLDDVRHLLAADHASKADVLRVESQRASAEQLRVRAEELAKVSEADLRVRLRQPTGELTIGERLDTDLLLDAPGELDALAADAMHGRPELAALSDAAEAQREQARFQWASALPRFDVVGSVTTADPNPRYLPPVDEFRQTWSIGAQLTWSPGDVPRQLAGARELHARADSTEFQRAKLADGIRLEIAQALAGVREATAAQSTARQGLAAAEESYRVRLALFRDGRATSTELTDAETELTRARLDAIDARIAARTAAIQLSHATGRDR